MESKELINGGEMAEITNQQDNQNKLLKNDSVLDLEPTKLEIPKIEKKLGDVKLSEKDYEAAIHHYKNSIMALKILFDDDQFNNGLDDLKAGELIEEIGIPVHLNLAFCYLQLEEKWETVIYYCNKVLELKPDQIKALYRRCKAYLKLKNLEKAQKDIEELEKYLKPDSDEIKGLKAQLMEIQQIKEKEIENTYMNLKRGSKINKQIPQIPQNEDEGRNYYTINFKEIENLYEHYLQKLPIKLQSIVIFGVNIGVKLPFSLSIRVGQKIKYIAWDFPIYTTKKIANDCVISPLQWFLNKICPSKIKK